MYYERSLKGTIIERSQKWRKNRHSHAIRRKEKLPRRKMVGYIGMYIPEKASYATVILPIRVLGCTRLKTSRNTASLVCITHFAVTAPLPVGVFHMPNYIFLYSNHLV